MEDLLDCKRSQNVDTRMAGGILTKKPKEYCVKINDSIWEWRESPSQKQNSGRNGNLSYRDHLTLTQILMQDYKNTPWIITAEFNDNEHRFLKNYLKGAAQNWILREGCNQKPILK